MSEQELRKLKVAELDQICKDYGLPRYKGKTHLNKAEMIQNIIWYEAEKVEETEEVLAKDSSKQRYIENAEVGSIVAFNDKRGRTRSGKIVKNDSEKKMFDIEIKSGRIFYVLYNEILWVTTEDNKRWPKDILRLLKESQRQIVEDFKNRQ